MNIKWRLARKLVSGLSVVGVLLLAIAVFILLWSSDRTSQIEATREFESAGLYQLVKTLQKDQGLIRFDPKLLEMIRENGGWLQRIDENGKVNDSYMVPPDVPTSYSPGQLTGYWLKSTPFPYELYLWIQEKNGTTYTLLYGKSNEDKLLLEGLVKRTEFSEKGMLKLSPKDEALLKSRKSWLQVLDENGTEIASTFKPYGFIGQYSLQELALRSVYFDKYGTKVLTYYEPQQGLTWVLSTPLDITQPGKQPLLDPELKILISATSAVIGLSMLIFALFAWWFGQRIGSPILHMMDWLKALSRGNYTEPLSKSGQSISIGQDGKRKRNFAIYEDVMDSLATLASTLKRDAIARKETDKARDEWIAGVSHDLKTPLSSIKGYAHMLENEDYEWSAEEVRSFAKVMLDKSNHMEGLISELTLEYQLRSGVTPPYTELVELNAYIPETLYGAGISQDNQAVRIVFIASDRPVYLNVYKPWFQRIVDNLTVNAFLHNHADTILTVTVLTLESGKIGLSFSDNGNGMDEETQIRLFERYYRGTDTESATEGSGLGMAVARALVEVHQGVIQVKSEKGRGTDIQLLWEGQSSSK